MENKYYLDDDYGLGVSVVKLMNREGKCVAYFWSDEVKAHQGESLISYESFEALVKATTGKELSWEWDNAYELYYPCWKEAA